MAPRAAARLYPAMGCSYSADCPAGGPQGAVPPPVAVHRCSAVRALRDRGMADPAELGHGLLRDAADPGRRLWGADRHGRLDEVLRDPGSAREPGHVDVQRRRRVAAAAKVVPEAPAPLA